jgi:hypothetical protein
MADVVDADIKTEHLFWDREHRAYTNKYSRKSRYIQTIPLVWLSVALTGSQNCIRCALLVQYVTGLQRTNTVVLSNKYVKEFGLNRWTKIHALKALEAKGLVTVKRYPGRSPTVTVLTDLADGD